LTEIRLSEERSAAMRCSGKGMGVAVTEFKTERKSPKTRKETVCKAKHTRRVKIYIQEIGRQGYSMVEGGRLAREINIRKIKGINAG
jgi:hypothetical protein